MGASLAIVLGLLGCLRAEAPVSVPPAFEGGSRDWRSPPSDPLFMQTERETWWWFNRHRLFQAWEVLGSQAPLPAIAVIDTGFDVAPEAWDAPNYRDPASFVNGAFAGTDVTDVRGDPLHQESHGTKMACLIASPRDNRVAASGVVPGATIVPIKVDRSVASIAEAIRHAAEHPSVGVICISMTLGFGKIEKPITLDPAIREAIRRATGVARKAVVLAAGNSGLDLDRENLEKAGDILVGASTVQADRWSGSNQGRAVDLAAAGKDVTVVNYNPYKNWRYIVSERGTSEAAAIVAGAAAMVRAVGGDALKDPQVLRDILVGSARVGPTRLRDLQAWQALVLAKLADRPMVVRVANVDDRVEVRLAGKSAQPLGVAPYLGDRIWDLSALRLQAGEKIVFSTFNQSGERASQYQIYRFGRLVWERIHGVATQESWWNGQEQEVHDLTRGDSPDRSSGWHDVESYTVP